MFHFSPKGLPVVALLTAAFYLFGTSCATNPVTGKKDLMLMSEQQEIALGAQSDPSIVATFGLYQDSVLQNFINEKGQEMAKISHRSHLNYEFKIMDSPVVNAFAVPGGYVYFTRGILAHFNNEAEFAGVLGHEIGHITARHSAKQYSKQVLAQVGLIAGMVISPEFASFGDVAQQSLGLLFLKFSRDNESQSDELGVEYSTRIGYESHHMANFFQTLARMRPEGQSIPDFMSTHPNPLDRYNRVHQLSDEWQQKLSATDLQTGRESYLRMIDGLVYGEDPRQGYVENSVFYHPELKFQYPIPQGWRTNNSPQQVQSSPEDGKALLILTLSPEQTLEAAAQGQLEQHQLQLVDRKSVNVNGFPAIAMVSDQVNQQNPDGSLRILTYLIQYNDLIYVMHGLSLKSSYTGYANTFARTMKAFKRLTDPSKINRTPERIDIKTVNADGTLSDAFRTHRVASDRYEELAVLNGMELETEVKRGMLIKVIGK